MQVCAQRDQQVKALCERGSLRVVLYTTCLPFHAVRTVVGLLWKRAQLLPRALSPGRSCLLSLWSAVAFLVVRGKATGSSNRTLCNLLGVVGLLSLRGGQTVVPDSNKPETGWTGQIRNALRQERERSHESDHSIQTGQVR